MKKLAKIFIAIIFIILIIFAGNFCIREVIYPRKYQEIVADISDRYEVDENLIYAIIKTESNFNKNATSKVKAKGLMQIVDDTAIEISKKIGIENFDISMLYEPEINIEIGTYYFKELYDKYKNKTIAIIAYNAGQGNVDKWIESGIITGNTNLDDIPYNETTVYWRKVLREYSVYKKLYGNS